MAFNNFTLPSVVEQFGLTVTNRSLFDSVPAVDVGSSLRYALNDFGQLAVAINTEKARSEWLIAPVLGEVWYRGEYSLFVLSGVDFTVDEDAGLTGVVDFLVGRGPQLSFILNASCPILAVVEAKNECIPRRSRPVRRRNGRVAAIQSASENGHSHGVRRRHHGHHMEVPPVGGHRPRHRHPRILDLRSRSVLGVLLHIVGLHPSEPKD